MTERKFKVFILRTIQLINFEKFGDESEVADEPGEYDLVEIENPWGNPMPVSVIKGTKIGQATNCWLYQSSINLGKWEIREFFNEFRPKCIWAPNKGAYFCGQAVGLVSIIR